MPELIYKISGDNSGLINAANGVIIKIENITDAVNSANGSLQFKSGVAALDTLGKSLLVAQGNASLFGDSIATQKAELSAYQTAINSLLSNGFDPMDGDVQRLKAHVDELTASLKSVKGVQVPGSFVNDTSILPSRENLPTNNIGSTETESEAFAALNAQYKAGTLSLQEYNAILLSANSTENTFAESAQNANAAIQEQDGYLAGLKQALAQLNQIQLNAPEEALAGLNAEIQETEIAIKQAANIGKVGFDEFGNAVKGVSLGNVNGQLIALSNNLFGARQIAKDVVRTFDTNSLTGFARGVGLLAVDFLYYAQNAQFAAGATTVATGAIATESGVAATAGISTAALGAAFASLLTPVNLIILGVALLGGGLLAYEKSQKNATSAAKEHEKALADQKKALDEYISTLSEQEQAEAKAADNYGSEVAKLDLLHTALVDQISAGKDYTKSLNELQDAFPVFFANLDTATAKTGALQEAFIKATTAFKDLGIATATQKLAQPELENIAANTVAQQSISQQLTAAKAAYETALQGTRSGTKPNNNANSDALTDESSHVADLREQYLKLQDQSDDYGLSIEQSNIKLQQLARVGAQFKTQADALNAPLKGSVAYLEQELKSLQAQEPFLATQQQRNENIAKQKALQAEIDADNLKINQNISSENAKQLSIQQQIADVLSKSGADATKSGLTGYALQVADITAKYVDLATQLDKIAVKIQQQGALFAATNGKKGLSPTQVSADNTALNAAQVTLSLNESKQLSDAQIKDAQNTSDAITKINNDFGIRERDGYNEQLARIKSLYDNTINTAKEGTLTLEQINANYQAALLRANGNVSQIDAANTNYAAQIQQAKDATAKIAAANADLLPAIQAIDAKYIQQEQELYDKIVDIANQAFTALDDGEASRTDKINTEYAKRLGEANKYFDQLRTLAVASNLPSSSVDNINQVQAQVNIVLDASRFKQVSEEISKNFADAMQTAVQGFVSDFYSSLTGLGAARSAIDEKYASQLNSAQDQATRDQTNRIKQLEQQATTSFGAIFSTLVSKFSASFNQSILQSFTKQFTENLGKTLIQPTAKQLTISPEEKSAQNVAALLKGAGVQLADQIKQAGADFAAKVTGGVGSIVSPSLLSGASGGSSLGNISELPGGLDNFSLAGNTFSTTVGSSADTFHSAITDGSASLVTASDTAASTTLKAADGLSTKLAGAAAAFSLAGGLISGATSPTSSLGQGAGGLLQGAGEGALIGSAIPGIGTVAGGVIGGIIGLASGLFGASKAQKALQQQQLEEAQQQTALLKASLAYTSQIIGRDTANGVVTGISVNATGQLTATVSGKDLQFVLDRNANGR